MANPRLCWCDGRYEGCEHKVASCPNPVDAPRSAYWCKGCDARRCAHITSNLENIAGQFGGSDDEC